jgi:hypothetical protein
MAREAAKRLGPKPHNPQQPRPRPQRSTPKKLRAKRVVAWTVCCCTAPIPYTL